MKNLTVPVVFEVELDPGSKGVVPRLMGSISELGFWETAYGVDARRIAKDSPIWKVKVHIPQRSFFYFNWVLMKKGEVVEEDQYRQADIGVFGGLMKTKYGEGSGEFIMDGGCKVSVATHYHLSYNESLAVVGSGDFLGNWESSGSSKCFSMNDVWSTKFEMKQETTEEFRLVILNRESGQIKRWQDGGNRVIKIEEGLNSKSLYVPWAGRYLQEGIIIPIITIVECFENRPTVEALSGVSSPPNLSRAASKLFLTNGELDAEISKDLELTLAQNPTFKDVMALLCNDDNSNKPRKTLPRTKFTLDLQALIGVEHGDTDGGQEANNNCQASLRLAVKLDLGICSKDDSQKSTTEDVAKSGTSEVQLLLPESRVSSPRDLPNASLRQLPFSVADDCCNLPHQGKSEVDNFFESVWVSKKNIDAVLVELSRMTEEKLAMRINGGAKKPTAIETALSTGDSTPQDLKRKVSTAVSSRVPRPDVSDSLKLRPSFAANEFLEETKNSEYKLPEYERTWSSGNAIDAVLVELSRMTEEKLAMRINGGAKKPTAKETALSTGDSSPQDLKRKVSTAVSSRVPRPDDTSIRNPTARQDSYVSDSFSDDRSYQLTDNGQKTSINNETVTVAVSPWSQNPVTDDEADDEEIRRTHELMNNSLTSSTLKVE
ncbi:hypothetical protein LOTGIDRAFT_167159, partial [Lottia gigantea]